MNVIRTIQDYINKMITSVAGMKVLLMDRETIGIVSLVFSQSQVLQKEVYLFETLDQSEREQMPHLKAICFLRPTKENLRLLEAELRAPKYGEYHLFFSNSLKTVYIEELAEADEHECVQQLQEFFGDYYAINPDVFSLNLDSVISMENPQWDDQLSRIVDGLSSCLLSLKKQPNIRYVDKSPMVRKVVSELQKRVAAEPGLFDFRKQDPPPLLLILDRKDDPVTPLLTQWTYQAMVHELIGISKNRVDLSGVPGIKKEMQEFVLSCEQDPWFEQNMYSNFGDLGERVKELVDEYGRKTKHHQNIQSLDDIKRFVEDYPEFRKQAGNVSKHVTLMGEVSRIIEQRSLLQVSELEQELVNATDHSTHLKFVKEALDNPKLKKIDYLKLVILFALHYDTNVSEIHALTDKLFQNGLSSEEVGLIANALQYGGSNARGLDLFNSKNLMSRLKKNIQRGMKGVENVYTEHKPLLKQILEAAVTNKLSEAEFPFAQGGPSKNPPHDIIVFIVGGATFEEALTIHEFNVKGFKVVLGGTTIHNSTSFLRDLRNLRSFSLR